MTTAKAYAFPEKIVRLTAYEPITGEFPVRLDANESFLPLEQELSDRIQRAVAEVALNRYPDPFCVPLCRQFAQVYGLEDLSGVVAGNGSDELISILVSCLFDKGAKLLSLSPDFSMYSFYPSLYEMESVILEKGSDLTVNVDLILDFIRQNQVEALLFSNPCNPTSLGLSSKEVLRLVDSTEVLVIVDEAYMEFYGDSVLLAVADRENLIVLKTCSKALGMASIRLGFAVTNPKLAQMLRTVKSPYNVSGITQAIGEQLLSDRDYLRHCTREILKSRDWLQKELCQLESECSLIEKVYLSDCNFVTVKMKNSSAIFEALLAHGIVVRCLNEEFLRITAGSPADNARLIASLRQILSPRKEETSALGQILSPGKQETSSVSPGQTLSPGKQETPVLGRKMSPREMEGRL